MSPWLCGAPSTLIVAAWTDAYKSYVSPMVALLMLLIPVTVISALEFQDW